MTAKSHLLLILLAFVACTEGVLIRHNPPQNIAPATANRKPPQPPGYSTGENITFTLESTTTATTTGEEQPNPTEHSTGDGEVTPTEGSMTSTLHDATGDNTWEQEQRLYNQVYTTDTATGLHTVTPPGNEFVSSLHFWSPANGTFLTISFISSKSIFTSNMTTIMPRRWHSVDIHQPADLNSTVELFFRTKTRYIKMDYSRVVQIQTSSNDLVHWCFCPNSYSCALLAAKEPVEGKTYSSVERVGLVAALVVMVLLLVASLVALAVVTFYRKAELFHIYAKPIDCLPNGPPPLPKANTEPIRHYKDIRTDTQLAEAQNGAAVTDQPDVTMNGKVLKGSAVQSRPSSLAYPPVSYLPHKIEHESINSLYGLI